jgi:hypothetical protein
MADSSYIPPMAIATTVALALARCADLPGRLLLLLRPARS